MTRRTYPLELILRAHGPAELVNAQEDVLWASDSDDDFREEFNDEFLAEEDIGDILEYLEDAEIISMEEFDKLSSDEWDCTVETLDQGPEDDEDGDEEDETEEID